MSEQAIPVTTLDRDNPWPGLLAFRESDEDYFQGRKTETEDLLRLVLRERLTVLFGLSGLGKSSLLQAGLFPKLRQRNFFPVYIRLDFTTQWLELAAQVIATIGREASINQIEAPTARESETLWEYFHRDRNNFWTARNRPLMPLLVFDQFEETFTLGRVDPKRSAATEAFLLELADLGECRPPASLKAHIDEHPEEASGFNFERHYYKILLGIREDFLPDLETLRASMPAVALNRMRLQRMNGEAALLVVNQAQRLIDPDVADQVVRFVAADKGNLSLPKLEIEPALLSVVCRELNTRRQKNHEDKISADLLKGNQEQLLADFYERSTADLAPEVRSFIEDKLLTVSGFRNSESLDNVLGTPGFSSRAIETLIDRRLVRRDDRSGTPRLELSHDLLAGIVRASRDSRREREAAEKERAELDRLRRTRVTITTLAVVFAALFVCTTYFWWSARGARGQAESRAQEAKAKTEELDRIKVRLLLQNGWSKEQISRSTSDPSLISESILADEKLQSLSKPISSVLIWYYEKAADEKQAMDALIQYWRLLGYRPKTLYAFNEQPTNVVWFHDDVPVADLKRVSLSLIRSGVQLRKIMHLPGTNKGVFVGYDIEFSDLPPWSVNEIMGRREFSTPRSDLGQAYVAVTDPTPEQGKKTMDLLIGKGIEFKITTAGRTGATKTIATALVTTDKAQKLKSEMESEGIMCELRLP